MSSYTLTLSTAVLLGASSAANAFAPPGIVPSASHHPQLKSTSHLRSTSESLTTETDVVVIGSGLAGLSAAALLSHCEIPTLVLESHDTVGGAAHSWTRKGFHFESGPSLYSGFSTDRSPNPLANIFQIIGESEHETLVRPHESYCVASLYPRLANLTSHFPQHQPEPQCLNSKPLPHKGNPQSGSLMIDGGRCFQIKRNLQRRSALKNLVMC